MVLPEFITLPNWAATLIVDFPDDNIPLLTDEKNWRDWGDLLVQEGSFIDNNAPGTLYYKGWKEWADEVYFVMNNNGN